MLFNKTQALNNNFNLIRLLAATQVLVVHACNHFGYDSLFIKLLKGFPGVPLFFFISGYLIGGTYIKNHHKGLKVFFRNRILRLFPALIFCTAVSIISVYLSGYFSHTEFSFKGFMIWILGQISFFQFYNPEFMRHYGVGVLNGALWTISVEIQFYLITPLIFILLKKMKPVFFVLFAASILLNIYIKLYPNWNSLFMKLLTVSFLPWVYIFMMGYLVSYFSSLPPIIKKIPFFPLLILYCLSMVFIGSYHNNAMNSINPVSSILLSALVLKVGQMTLRLPEPARNFVDKNDISYGVYIYHMPVINLLMYLNMYMFSTNIALTIISTITMAFLSWTLIEKWALRLKV